MMKIKDEDFVKQEIEDRKEVFKKAKLADSLVSELEMNDQCGELPNSDTVSRNSTPKKMRDNLAAVDANSEKDSDKAKLRMTEGTNLAHQHTEPEMFKAYVAPTAMYDENGVPLYGLHPSGTMTSAMFSNQDLQAQEIL